MGVHRLNHAVLYVRNVAESVEFYRTVLGFEPIGDMAELRGAAFLQAPGSTNDHDLGLFEVGSGAASSNAGRAGVGLYHLAWEVDTLADLKTIEQRLRQAGALVGATDHGTTKALYGQDPNGLEFEVCWLVPADLITEDAKQARSRLEPLDLDREIERYGADSHSGIGISRVAVAQV
jgi:catechol-2,3-dioxygenase